MACPNASYAGQMQAPENLPELPLRLDTFLRAHAIPSLERQFGFPSCSELQISLSGS